MMTTRISSNTLINQIHSDNEETEDHIASLGGEPTRVSSLWQETREDQEIYYLNQTYYFIKERLNCQFYFCLLANSTFLSFVKMVDNKKRYACKCQYRQISLCNHTIHSCSQFKKWFKHHDWILNRIYSEILTNICSYERWSEYAFLRSVNHCCCFEVSASPAGDGKSAKFE